MAQRLVFSQSGWFAFLTTILAAGWLAPQAASADAPDPLALLRESAAAVERADSATVEFVATTEITREERTDLMESRYAYRTAPGGRFAFEPVTPDGSPAKQGYRVAGNGRVTLIQLISRRRHMLEPDDHGFAAFVRTPSAEAMGSGLGALALSLLTRDTTEQLAAAVTKSEYLGVEEVDGRKLHHARYALADGLTWDAWFAAEGAPLVQKIVPDLEADPGVVAMSRRYERFAYEQRFDFVGWNVEAGLTKADIPVAEPDNSMLVASLFQSPPRPPHPLLGKAAPKLTLANLDGGTVDLGVPGDGRVTMLEFWSTGCPICIEAMPQLERLAEEYGSRGLDYYAVNVGEEPELVAAFAEARGVKAEVLIDTEGDAGDAYDVRPIPLIVLIGPDGVVHVADIGFPPGKAKQLAGAVESLLAGENLAAAELDRRAKAEANRVAERERLRKLLDS